MRKLRRRQAQGLAGILYGKDGKAGATRKAVGFNLFHTLSLGTSYRLDTQRHRRAGKQVGG